MNTNKGTDKIFKLRNCIYNGPDKIAAQARRYIYPAVFGVYNRQYVQPVIFSDGYVRRRNQRGNKFRVFCRRGYTRVRRFVRPVPDFVADRTFSQIHPVLFVRRLRRGARGKQ